MEQARERVDAVMRWHTFNFASEVRARRDTAPDASGYRAAWNSLDRAFEGARTGAAGADKARTRRAELLRRLKELSPGGERVDWVLTDTVPRPLVAEYLSAAEAHIKYFDQPDVAHFVIQQCDRAVPGSQTNTRDAEERKTPVMEVQPAS
mmetsp:Transcript_50166/g.100691  ORF Transcript_50166/g.100691 Transcript_50166/m.100691 type:complete len:150 (+) Transcript_50166:220-669(+)